MSRSTSSTDSSEEQNADPLDECIEDMSLVTLSATTYHDHAGMLQSSIANDQEWEAYWIPFLAQRNITVVSGSVDDRVAGRVYATAAVEEAWSAVSFQPMAHAGVTSGQIEGLVAYLRGGWIGRQAFQAMLQVETFFRLRVSTSEYETLIVSNTPGYRFSPWYHEEREDFTIWYPAIREMLHDVLTLAINEQEQPDDESNVAMMDADEDRDTDDDDAEI